MRQHERTERGRDEQRAHDLHREHVVGEDHVRDPDGVGVLVRDLQAHRLGVHRGADHAHEDGDQAEPCEPSGPPLTADGLDERVGRPDADEHQHEQEQHHDRAGVDDHLHHAEEHGALRHVDERERDHHDDQAQRGVHGLAGEQQTQRGEHHDRAEHPEERLLGSRGLAAVDQHARDEGREAAHRVPCLFAAATRRAISAAVSPASCCWALAASMPAPSGSVASSGRCSRTQARCASVGPEISPR